MKLPGAIDRRPALLVVAHPGHEIRVHGWLEVARPEVWVLTDGAGRGPSGRLDSSRTLIERAGARSGEVFGAFSDRRAYDLLLRGDVAPVGAIVLRLADRLAALPGAYVVGDALEGFNPLHDLCRVAIDLAAAIARRRTGRDVDCFDFPLEATPDAPGTGGGEADLRLRLDEPALARKLAAARDYPELAAEVERALDAFGAPGFAIERLRPGRGWATLLAPLPAPPLYESHGEERVAAGHYRETLRLREHFVPFAERLAATADEATIGGG